MKVFVHILGLLALLSSCSEELDPKDIPPVDLLSKEEMAQAIVSLHLHSVAGQNIYKSQVVTKPMAVKTGAYVLDSLGIDTANFRVSFDYYREHLDQMSEIYTIARDSISLRITKYDASNKK